MTPLERYQQQVSEGKIFLDSAQLDAMKILDRVYRDLFLELEKRETRFSFFRKPHLVKGAYLWGGVGIGKTFMMDCFYYALPFEKKLRLHFHQFMRRIHEALVKHQGEKNPLQVIAKELSQETSILCFDEFFVSDITDAVILGRLFSLLYSEGVCIVATSNLPPDDLYKNGLQREQFMPAIQAIKKSSDVVHIPTVIDYRLRHLQEAGVFFTPLNDDSQKKMEDSFLLLAQDDKISFEPISIYDRFIKIKKQAGDIVWFDFKDICRVPRSQSDYLIISKKYKTVFISDIPIISEREKDTICLFISLVDVLYDARVRLVISAAEPVHELYNRGYMIMEYTRTNSRLLEMQSKDYFINESRLNES